MDLQAESFRQQFQALDLEERQNILDELAETKDGSALNLLYQNPEIFLFDKQIVTGNQRYTIFCCGRAFGKTHLGSAWVARKVLNGAKAIGLIGPTHADVEQVMVRAILQWFPPGEAKYTGGDKKTITFKNYRATIYCYSADTEVRGPNLEYLWCDEIVKWNDAISEKVEETFSTADFAVRIGNNPQTLVTSTPKPFDIFIKWKKKTDENNPLYKMYRGTMFDNPFLSEQFKQAIIDEYAGDQNRYKQEVLGEIIDGPPGAAWTQKMIDDTRITKHVLKNRLNWKPKPNTEDFKRALSGVPTQFTTKEKFSILKIVVAVDPSVSDNPGKDECGIVVAALGSDNHVYVLADHSGSYTTDEWAQKSIKVFRDSGAGCIVIEKNNGGELVKKNISSLDPSIPIKTVTATVGKIDRALPVSALYARGQVHHVMESYVDTDGNIKIKDPLEFAKLESQMTRYTGNPKEKSPDRLDALCWAVHELRLNQTYTYRDVSSLGYY